MDQEALKKKIEAALRKACLPDKTPTIELEASNVSRVGGRVISKRFAKMTQTARQDLIWSFLDKSLTAHEATQNLVHCDRHEARARRAPTSRIAGTPPQMRPSRKTGRPQPRKTPTKTPTPEDPNQVTHVRRITHACCRGRRTPEDPRTLRTRGP